MAAVVDLVERIGRVHDCRVVALRHPPGASRLRDRGGAGVRARCRASGRRAGRAEVLARGVRAVVRLHRRRPVDLVHALWLDEPGAVATIAGRIIRRPVVASVMGGELVGLPDIGYGAALGRGGRWTTALTLRGADLVTVGSTLVGEAVTARRATARRRSAAARRRPRDLPAGRSRGGRIGALRRTADDPVRRQPRTGQGPGGGRARVRTPRARPPGPPPRDRRRGPAARRP